MFLTVLIISNMFVIMSITTVAAQTSGKFEYRILSNNTAEITKYLGDDSNLSIPSILNGYSVTSIGNKAFDGNSNLVKVTIPDSVTNVGDYAFRACTSLLSYDIPNSVTSFGKNVLNIVLV